MGLACPGCTFYYSNKLPGRRRIDTAQFRQSVASVGDGLMAALAAHIAGVVIPAFRTSSMSLFLIAVFIAIGELKTMPYIHHKSGKAYLLLSGIPVSLSRR